MHISYVFIQSSEIAWICVYACNVSAISFHILYLIYIHIINPLNYTSPDSGFCCPNNNPPGQRGKSSRVGNHQFLFKKNSMCIW